MIFHHSSELIAISFFITQKKIPFQYLTQMTITQVLLITNKSQ